MKADPKRDRTARALKLIKMGFEIAHEDSNVGMGGYDFDFSAVNLDDPESVLRHVIHTVAEKSSEEGEYKTINAMRNVLRLGPLAI